MQKTLSRSTIAVLAVILIAGLTGCTGSRSSIKPAPQHMQTQEEMETYLAAKPAGEIDGSLWQVRSSLNGMFIDTKARNVGDIVTVRIDESAEASNKANTATGRTSSLEAGIEKLFGIYFHNEQFHIGASLNDILLSDISLTSRSNEENKRDFFIHMGYKFFLKRFELEPSAFMGWIDNDIFYYYGRLKMYYLNYNWFSLAYRSSPAINNWLIS